MADLIEYKGEQLSFREIARRERNLFSNINKVLSQDREYI